MLLGNNFNRPALLELECAQMLQSLVPSAEMVKFAKDGSAILTAALKLARAYTGRELIAIGSDSPFFSYNHWFIGQTAMDGGIPPIEKSLTVTFNYNDIDSLKKVFDAHPGRHPDGAARTLAHRLDPKYGPPEGPGRSASARRRFRARRDDQRLPVPPRRRAVDLRGHTRPVLLR